MIVRELICRKCAEKTFHEEKSPDTWRCKICGNVKIEHARVKSSNLVEVFAYLYNDDGIFYFDSLFGVFAIKDEDIHKLENGEFRVPIYKVSKFSGIQL